MAERCGRTRGGAECKPADALQTAHDEREPEVIDCAAELAKARGAGFNSRRGGTPGDLVTSLGFFSIRKRLDLLGGRFETDSSLGKGSRFTLQAPVSPGTS